MDLAVLTTGDCKELFISKLFLKLPITLNKKLLNEKHSNFFSVANNYFKIQKKFKLFVFFKFYF